MRQPERFSLAGRHAFITGAARGIGFETALALGESGASIVISDRDQALVDDAIARLAEKGITARGVTLDITDSAQCEALATEYNSNGHRIDILVANAGIAWPDTAAEDMSDEAWLKVIDTNLNGTFWTCRAFGRHMVSRQHGSIVTVGSMSGVISNKPQRQVHYNASKAGVHHLTKSMAGEWAERHVRVNCVAPTYVNTVMSNVTAKDETFFKPWMDSTPMRRMVEPEEVASAIVFLASEAASAITGTILLTDAGYTIW
jgi:NAD(P)-dependent dehydrogenase (short-subunit alcohol dehydrogenase family)